MIVRAFCVVADLLWSGGCAMLVRVAAQARKAASILIFAQLQ